MEHDRITSPRGPGDSGGVPPMTPDKAQKAAGQGGAQDTVTNDNAVVTTLNVISPALRAVTTTMANRSPVRRRLEARAAQLQELEACQFSLGAAAQTELDAVTLSPVVILQTEDFSR